jgi:uncharacterized protein (DUF433 family)
MTEPLLQRISINPDICHGKPCVRGLRYPVEFLLELLSAGMTHEEILADYDDLEETDILATLLFAARLSKLRVCTDWHHEVSCRCSTPSEACSVSIKSRV